MTDIQNTQDAQETTLEENKPNIPTAEQEAAMRNHLYNGFLGEYKRFVNILVSSPVAVEVLTDGLKFLDTGMLWIKEAVYHGPLVNKQPVASPIENKESKEVQPE